MKLERRVRLYVFFSIDIEIQNAEDNETTPAKYRRFHESLNGIYIAPKLSCRFCNWTWLSTLRGIRSILWVLMGDFSLYLFIRGWSWACLVCQCGYNSSGVSRCIYSELKENLRRVRFRASLSISPHSKFIYWIM